MKAITIVRPLIALLLCLLLPLQAGATLARATAMVLHGGIPALAKAKPSPMAHHRAMDGVAHDRHGTDAAQGGHGIRGTDGAHGDHGVKGIPVAHGTETGHGMHAAHGEFTGSRVIADDAASGKLVSDEQASDKQASHEAASTSPASIQAAANQQVSGKSASHQAKHAKAGCADCAKCCLQAASAPPPMLPAVFVPTFVRAAFIAQQAPAPAFLTDGPERPPRQLIA